MIYFSSLNKFKIADLRSSSSKSNVWTSSGIVSIDCFFPVYVGYIFLLTNLPGNIFEH